VERAAPRLGNEARGVRRVRRVSAAKRPASRATARLRHRARVAVGLGGRLRTSNVRPRRPTLCTKVCNVDWEFVTRHPRLENPPLTVVICQMRFPRQIGIDERELRPVQKTLAADYPNTKIARTAELALTPTGISAMGEPDQAFQFASDDGAWTVTVGPDAMSLETTAYLDVLDFLKRWHRIATAVVDALDIERQTRIGLRYVNEMSLQSSSPLTADDLRAWVRPVLFGVVGAHARTGRLVSSSNELRFAQDPGVCTLRHGLVQRDDATAAYVLDMDFYDDVPAPVDLDAQARVLADFAHGAYEIFEWALDPAYLEKLGPKEETPA
jgi:uncharacterized protein (TIGR04255 family)